MAAEIATPETVEDSKQVTKRAPKGSRGSIKPMRTVAIFAAVSALVAAVALPAYAVSKTTDASATTVQQMAFDGAQSLVVASKATTAPLDRGSYAATTPEEIAKKKAEEAARKRAAAAAAAAAAARENQNNGGGGGNSDADYTLTSSGSGEVRYPLPRGSYYVSRTVGGGHEGADMVAPAGTPIFATADGVVRVSSEGYGAYGVAVVIDSVVGGKRVSSIYAHMTYGTRGVSAGQTVKAGQFIGKVGNTGRSYGAHLHFEVRVNGSLVEPISWLRANAG